MGFYDGAKIVTNGLVLAFDAGDRNSYPGSGTTWRDLATNRTATITGTYSFNSENGGHLTGFNNNDTRIDVNSPDLSTIGPCTIQSVFTYEGNQNEGVGPFRYLGATNFVSINSRFGTRELQISSDGGSRSAVWGSLLDVGKWYFVSGIRDTTNLSMSISVNAQTRVTNTYASLPTITPTSSHIVSSNTTGGNVLNGKIAIVLFYNRALSVAEELQNYYAIKSRFGL